MLLCILLEDEKTERMQNMRVRKMKKLRGCKRGDKLPIFSSLFFGRTKKAGVNYDVQSSSSLHNGWLLIVLSAALFVACRPAIVNAAAVKDDNRMVAATSTHQLPLHS